MPAMQFFVMDELTGQQTGPYSLMQIQEQISSRQLKKKDFVRRADSTQWGKASVILGQVFIAGGWFHPACAGDHFSR